MQLISPEGALLLLRLAPGYFFIFSLFRIFFSFLIQHPFTIARFAFCCFFTFLHICCIRHFRVCPVYCNASPRLRRAPQNPRAPRRPFGKGAPIEGMGCKGTCPLATGGGRCLERNVRGAGEFICSCEVLHFIRYARGTHFVTAQSGQRPPLAAGAEAMQILQALPHGSQRPPDGFPRFGLPDRKLSYGFCSWE